jgi:hypothetical protein
MEDLYKICVGAIGISPTYFLDDMSMKAIALAYAGHDKGRQEQWEQTRHIAFYVARPYLQGNPSMMSFMPLQWDRKTGQKRSTRKRFKQLEQRLTKLINKNDHA